MSRVPLLSEAPFAARQALRARFRRLPSLELPGGFRPEGTLLPRDVDVVALLLDTTQTRNNLPTTASQEYATRQAQSPNAMPDWAEALGRGWFRVIDNEVAQAWPVRDYLGHAEPPPAYKQDLREFTYWLYEQQFHVTNPGSHGTAVEFESYLLDPERAGEQPSVLTPNWIAARLWDATQRQRDFELWATRWSLLKSPQFVPAHVWTPEDAQAFRDAALTAIRQSNLPGWTTGELADAIRRSGDIRTAPAAPAPPAHLLGKYLESGPHHQELYESSRLSALVGVLINELPHIQPGPVPSPTAEAILDLASVHASVLETLVHYLRQVPEALADFAMCPRATALVAYLVGTWEFQVPSERDSQDSANDSVQSSLFADCLDVLRHNLARDETASVEYAALLVVMQQHDAERSPRLPKVPILVAHAGNLPSSIRPQVRTALISLGTKEGNDAAFAAMLKGIAVLGDDLEEAQAVVVAHAYSSAMNSRLRTFDVSLLDASAAGILMHLALTRAGTAAATVTTPINVNTELAANPGKAIGLAQTLKAHIRVLSRAIVGYPDATPQAAVDALASAVRSGARDRPSRSQVDSFSFNLDPWRAVRQRPVESDLADAFLRLDRPEHQSVLLDALLEVEEPLVLTVLYQRAPQLHRPRIRARLEQLTPAQASQASFVQQLNKRVDAFLELGLVDLAEMYLQEQQERLKHRNVGDVAVSKLRAELQLHYLREEWLKLEQAAVPTELSTKDGEEATRTIDFYRALALLKRDPAVGGAAEAEAIFVRLYAAQPNPSYAINLLASRISKLLGTNLFQVLDGQARAHGKRVLELADTAIPDRGALGPLARATQTFNSAALLLAVGRSHDALRRLEELEVHMQTAESSAFEAVANARLGAHERAASLIRSAKERFGVTSVIAGAENHLAHAAPLPGAARVLMHEEAESQIRAALQLFSGLSPERQAAVLVTGALPLEQVVTELFRDTLASFERTISFLRLSRNKFEEDDYNGLLAEAAQARFDSVFGWQAHEQSPGGFTEKGNAGRRDWVLRRRGVDIAVFEGIISNLPNSERILDHLHKLFGYSTATVLLHVTYTFRPNVSEMVAAIKKVAEQAPSGTKYLGQRDILAEGARPDGIRAAYERGGVGVTVLFFVVDMNQTARRLSVGAPAALAPPGPPAVIPATSGVSQSGSGTDPNSVKPP